MTSTASDPRGHVKNQSIAVARRPSQRPTDGQRPQDSSSLSSKAASSSQHDAFEFLNGRRRRSLVYRGLLAVGALLLVLQLFRPALGRRKVASLSRARIAKLEGRGESHVLPSRYSVANLEDLPVCRRVLLFTFTGEHEFADEVESYLRASVISQKLGYTFLSDDQHWQYGSLRDYFLPNRIHCRPPVDWFVKDVAVPLGSKRWTSADRVYFSREILASADAWLRNEVLDAHAVQALSEANGSGILKEGETLPATFEEIFSDFAGAARELFGRPNDQLAIMIRSLRMELGLGEGGLRNRKHSPVWGGNKRAGQEARQAVEEITDEEQHDFEEAGGAERSDRGPMIGAQPTLQRGSAAAALKLLGAAPESVGNISIVFEGAQHAVNRLSKSTRAEPGYSRTRPLIFKGQTPTILAMTTDDAAYTALSADPAASSFNIQHTPPPPPASLRQWNSELKLGESPSTPSLTWAYEQKAFNGLSRSLRIQLTRYLVRDLITLSTHADAFVVAGSTSLGRLALLIGGLDAAVGPRVLDGSGKGGRVRSVDSPWYPTSTVQGLFD